MRSWWLCQTPEFSPFAEVHVPFIRSIGRWTMTALVINAIIGSGIFGLPSELTRLLGRASPLAMLVAAFAMATMILCMAEVASQFSEAVATALAESTACSTLPRCEPPRSRGSGNRDQNEQ